MEFELCRKPKADEADSKNDKSSSQKKDDKHVAQIVM